MLVCALSLTLINSITLTTYIMKLSKNVLILSVHGSVVFRVMKQLKEKVAQLFEPEEVEVNFTSEGKRVKYTYRKIERKQVA